MTPAIAPSHISQAQICFQRRGVALFDLIQVVSQQTPIILMHTRKYRLSPGTRCVHSGQILPSLIDVHQPPREISTENHIPDRGHDLYIAVQRGTGVATKLTHLCPGAIELEKQNGDYAQRQG